MLGYERFKMDLANYSIGARRTTHFLLHNKSPDRCCSGAHSDDYIPTRIVGQDGWLNSVEEGEKRDDY